MKTPILKPLCVLVLMAAFSGCVSAQVLKPADDHVRLSTNGRIYVGKTETPVRKLAAQLKKDGIDPKMQVTIEIPPNTPPQALTVISRELASNGYRRIVFSKPRQATAVKGEDPLLKDLH